MSLRLHGLRSFRDCGILMVFEAPDTLHAALCRRHEASRRGVHEDMRRVHRGLPSFCLGVKGKGFAFGGGLWFTMDVFGSEAPPGKYATEALGYR